MLAVQRPLLPSSSLSSWAEPPTMRGSSKWYQSAGEGLTQAPSLTYSPALVVKWSCGMMGGVWQGKPRRSDGGSPAEALSMLVSRALSYSTLSPQKEYRKLPLTNSHFLVPCWVIRGGRSVRFKCNFSLEEGQMIFSSMKPNQNAHTAIE